MDSQEFKFYYNLPYRESQPLRLHLIKPRQVLSACPLIILLHGGAWYAGNKESVLPLGLDLAARGYEGINRT